MSMCMCDSAPVGLLLFFFSCGTTFGVLNVNQAISVQRKLDNYGSGAECFSATKKKQSFGGRAGWFVSRNPVCKGQQTRFFVTYDFD